MAEGAQASLLIDENGNFVGIVLDGSVYRIETATKLKNTSDTFVDPATEDTLTTVDAKLATIDAVLDSIKDIDGIKKITDALPTGSNDIGSIRLRDLDGNGLVTTLESAIQRLEAVTMVRDSGGTIVDPSNVKVVGSPVPTGGTPVTGRDTDGNLRFMRLGTDGTQIITSQIIPTDLSKLVNETLKEAGGSDDMLVDADPTPVPFDYTAHVTLDTMIKEVKFVIVATNIDFDGTHFMKMNALTNGIKIEIRSENNTVEVFNIKASEDFLAFTGGFGGAAGDFLDQADVTDVLSSTMNLGSGVKLVAGSGDFVKVTIQDDIDVSGHYWLKCYVKGYQEVPE